MFPRSGSRTVSVRFSDYRLGIDRNDALQCLSLAQRNVESQILGGNAFKPIRQRLSYRFESVTLIFSPGSAVRWFYWGLALDAIPMMFDEYEFVGFEFMVVDTGPPAGLGSLISAEQRLLRHSAL